MPNKLKPCPFCGSKDIQVKKVEGLTTWRYIQCDHCGGRTDGWKDETLARKAWNKRSKESK